MNKKNYTTFDIAEICGVQPATVAYWIEHRQLRAHKTPGGHRRVIPRDLFEFLRRHRMPVPPQLAQAFERRVLVIRIAGLHPAQELDRGAARRCGVQLDVAEDEFQAGMLLADRHPVLVAMALDERAALPAARRLCARLRESEDGRKARVVCFSPVRLGKLEGLLESSGVDRVVQERLSLQGLLHELEPRLAETG